MRHRSRVLLAASHERTYKLECQTCREVAELHARADTLRAHIDGFSPRSAFPRGVFVELTQNQQIAVDWTNAITNCLKVGMATHARCGKCSILLGVGHEEPGIGGFCETHSGLGNPRLPEVREAPDEVLSWIAGSRGHSADDS